MVPYLNKIPKLHGILFSRLRNIKLGNVVVSQRGVWVTCPGDEEGQERKGSDGFLVPFSPPMPADSGLCLASIVIDYLDQLRSFLPHLGLDSPLFHETMKGILCHQNYKLNLPFNPRFVNHVHDKLLERHYLLRAGQGGGPTPRAGQPGGLPNQLLQHL